MKYTDEECERINHNYQIAVRNMNDRAWNVMLESEKLANLQDIENKLAMDEERIPSEVARRSWRASTARRTATPSSSMPRASRRTTSARCWTPFTTRMRTPGTG